MNTHPLHGLHWSARFSALQRQLVALVPGLVVGLGASGLAGAPASSLEDRDGVRFSVHEHAQ